MGAFKRYAKEQQDIESARLSAEQAAARKRKEGLDEIKQRAIDALAVILSCLEDEATDAMDLGFEATCFVVEDEQVPEAGARLDLKRKVGSRSHSSFGIVDDDTYVIKVVVRQDLQIRVSARAHAKHGGSPKDIIPSADLGSAEVPQGIKARIEDYLSSFIKTINTKK